MQNLECPICLNNIDVQKRIPKSLPCGHLICIECLRQIYSFQNQMICPLDQKKFNLQPDQLPNNFAIIQLLQNQQEEEILQCKKHAEKQEFFCKQDKQQICFKCLVSDHQQHDVSYAYKIFDEIKPNIVALNQQVLIQKEEINQKLNKAQENYNRLEAFYNTSSQKLIQLKEKIIKEIINFFDEKEKYLKDTLDQKKDLIQIEIEKLKQQNQIFQQFQKNNKKNINNFLEVMQKAETTIQNRILLEFQMNLSYEVLEEQIQEIMKQLQNMIKVQIKVDQFNKYDENKLQMVKRLDQLENLPKN